MIVFLASCSHPGFGVWATKANHLASHGSGPDNLGSVAQGSSFGNFREKGALVRTPTWRADNKLVTTRLAKIDLRAPNSTRNGESLMKSFGHAKSLMKSEMQKP